MKYSIQKPKDYVKVALPGFIKWVNALRSGKYYQGFNSLCKITPVGNAEYCCLGVLCETQGRLVIHGEDRMIDGEQDCLNWGALSTNNPLREILNGLGDIPNEVYIKADESERTYRFLSDMNDSQKFTFNDIADILEELYYEPEDTQIPSEDPETSTTSKETSKSE